MPVPVPVVNEYEGVQSDVERDLSDATERLIVRVEAVA